MSSSVAEHWTHTPCRICQVLQPHFGKLHSSNHTPHRHSFRRAGYVVDGIVRRHHFHRRGELDAQHVLAPGTIWTRFYNYAAHPNIPQWGHNASVYRYGSDIIHYFSSVLAGL